MSHRSICWQRKLNAASPFELPWKYCMAISLWTWAIDGHIRDSEGAKAADCASAPMALRSGILSAAGRIEVVNLSVAKYEDSLWHRSVRNRTSPVNQNFAEHWYRHMDLHLVVVVDLDLDFLDRIWDLFDGAGVRASWLIFRLEAKVMLRSPP